MKFKALFLASAIALTGGTANAAIDGVVGPAPIDTDLVLFIYDTAKDITYVQDLEVNYKEVLGFNGSFASTFNLDTGLLSQAFGGSNTSDLVWSMAAAGFDIAEGVGSTLGLITTTNAPQTTPTDYGQIDAVNGKFREIADTVNFSTPVGTGAQAATTGTGSGLSALTNAWGNNISFQTFTPNSAAINVAQQLWFLHLDDAYEAGVPSLLSANAWELDFVNAKLFSNAGGTGEVPLPAAGWLMLSGLLGLAGIARRRNNSKNDVQAIA